MLNARLFCTQDFQNFDLIYIMDESHHQRIAPFARTKSDMQKVDYVMNLIHPGKNLSVEDPWYGDIDGFEKVYKKLDDACRILAERIATPKPF